MKGDALLRVIEAELQRLLVARRQAEAFRQLRDHLLAHPDEQTAVQVIDALFPVEERVTAEDMAYVILRGIRARVIDLSLPARTLTWVGADPPD